MIVYMLTSSLCVRSLSLSLTGVDVEDGLPVLAKDVEAHYSAVG